MRKLHVFSIAGAIFVFVFTSACSRLVENRSLKMTIQAPQKVGAFAAIPVDRKPCYLANITATGIAGSVATTCSPATGILAGFVEAGQVIGVTVPSGTNRTVDLYMLLK